MEIIAAILALRVGISFSLCVITLHCKRGTVQATLCRYNSATNKLQALPLTTDHSPTLYDERMRIQKAGGYVRCVVD